VLAWARPSLADPIPYRREIPEYPVNISGQSDPCPDQPTNHDSGRDETHADAHAPAGQDTQGSSPVNAIGLMSTRGQVSPSHHWPSGDAILWPPMSARCVFFAEGPPRAKTGSRMVTPTASQPNPKHHPTAMRQTQRIRPVTPMVNHPASSSRKPQR